VRSLLSGLKLVLLVLLVPIVPFLLFGSQIDAAFERWQTSPPAAPVTATVIMLLLATDILLPVPSSLVSTLAGSQLGVLWGTLVCWTGMTAGAAIGFGLAKRWGQPLAVRLAKAEDLDRMQELNARYGPGILVVTRALPVLAEASVLLVGIHQLHWRRFLPPVLLSNLGIAMAYTAFGHYAQRHEWLPLALGISLAFPLLIGAVAHWWFRRHSESPSA